MSDLKKPGVEIADEGVNQGRAGLIDFVGAGVSASIVGGKAVVFIPGAAGATVESVKSVVYNLLRFDRNPRRKPRGFSRGGYVKERCR